MSRQIKPGKGLLQEALGAFLFHCKYEKGLNDKTLVAYKTDLAQFCARLPQGPLAMQSITREMIKDYLQALSCFKPKTIKRKIASLKAFFSFYEYEQADFINPLRKMRIHPKEPLVIPTVMEGDEIKLVLDYLYRLRNENHEKTTWRYKAQVRDIAVVELLFATGIRVSELCQLQCRDVDLGRGNIKVYGKGSKERIIQIGASEVLDILHEYKRLFAPSTYFWLNRLGNPLSTQSVRGLVKRCVEALKLEKHITPHTFRHTFATLLLEEDVDIKYIQHMLGHSSIVTTQIYTHVNVHKQKMILQSKHPRTRWNLQSGLPYGHQSANDGDAEA